MNSMSGYAFFQLKPTKAHFIFKQWGNFLQQLHWVSNDTQQNISMTSYNMTWSNGKIVQRACRRAMAATARWASLALPRP